MSGNADLNPLVCILAFNSAPTFWQKSLSAGRFVTPPVVRPTGFLERKRIATEEDAAKWQNHVKMAQGTKGHELLWKTMRTVGDIYFDSFESVLLGQIKKDPRR